MENIVKNFGPDKKTCEICGLNSSKYCCPRCNLLYCSIECYKCEKHQQCSESFYRDCVINDLSGMDHDNESRKKMIDILNRMKENIDIDPLSNEELNGDPESDDEEFPDLAERLSSLDLNNADLVWENLTNDERQEFESLLNSGNVVNIVPEFKPWWEYKKLIEEVSNSDTVECYSSCPALKPNIKRLDQISSNKPSPFVKYNIINVLGAYSMTVRYFIGEHQDSCLDAMICLINLSENLLNNQNFDNTLDALHSVEKMCVDKCITECDTNTFLELEKDVKNIINDLEKLKKKNYTKCALSDIHKLLSNAKDAIKANANQAQVHMEFTDRFLHHNDECIRPPIKNIKLYMKKIEYYLAYVASYSDEFIEIIYHI